MLLMSSASDAHVAGALSRNPTVLNIYAGRFKSISDSLRVRKGLARKTREQSVRLPPVQVAHPPLQESQWLGTAG